MASGLALVAPNSGGVTSYADASNAWLAEATGESFAAAVEAAGADRDGRVLNAQATAAQYDWCAIAADFLRFYRETAECFRGERAQVGSPPRFYSTPGDYWGRETESLTVAVR